MNLRWIGYGRKAVLATMPTEVRHLRLQEYRWQESVALSPADRDALMGAVPDLELTPTRGLANVYDLRPGATVGMIAVGTLVVEIRPKVPVDRVVFMLSYALGEADWREAVSVERSTSLTEAMVNVLVWHIERAVQRGVLHGYRAEDASLFGIRGRIRFEDQLRIHCGRPLPVEVRFDEFSPDILENRILKTALQVAGQLQLRNDSLAGAIRHVGQLFALVGIVPIGGGSVPTVTYTRLNEHYRAAVEWARLILGAASFETRPGLQLGRSLLFNMNRVFEEFIRASVRDELGAPKSLFPSGGSCPRRWLDRGRRIGLEPDLSWWQRGQCVFVGDVKYKWVGLDQKAKNADLFQLHAYTLGFDVPEGLLVYAGDSSELATYEVVNGGHKLLAMAVRLDGDLPALRAECRRVAANIREMAAAKKASDAPGASRRASTDAREERESGQPVRAAHSVEAVGLADGAG